VDTARLQELKNLVLERLDEHPGLKQIYSDGWVEEQFRAGPTRGFHPVVQILLGFRHGARLAAGMQKAWLALTGQRDPGAIGRRRSWLRGSLDRSWQDNHNKWWSCIAEIYLAAYLATQGYGVRLCNGGGPDLALSTRQADAVGHVEVHSPRQSLEANEFQHHLFWALQDKPPLDLSLTAKPSWDSLSLAGDNAAALARQVAQLYDTVTPTTPLPLNTRLTLPNGCVDVEIGPGEDSAIHYHTDAVSGARSFPSALLEDIVARAERKRRQLSGAPRWAAFAVEVAAYHPVPFYIHLFDTTADASWPFPAELPDYVAALIIYAVNLTEVQPGAARVFPNPRSPWARDPPLLEMLHLFDRPLRRKGHSP
jgi:hypothetical protein